MLRGIANTPAYGAYRRRHLICRTGDGLHAGAGLACGAGNRIGLGSDFIGGLRQGFRITFQPHGRCSDAADDIGHKPVGIPNPLVKISGMLALTLRFRQLALRQVLPLDTGCLEDFKRAGHRLDNANALPTYPQQTQKQQKEAA
jgi:hypothetical protein